MQQYVNIDKFEHKDRAALWRCTKDHVKSSQTYLVLLFSNINWHLHVYIILPDFKLHVSCLELEVLAQHLFLDLVFVQSSLRDFHNFPVHFPPLPLLPCQYYLLMVHSYHKAMSASMFTLQMRSSLEVIKHRHNNHLCA